MKKLSVMFLTAVMIMAAMSSAGLAAGYVYDWASLKTFLNDTAGTKDENIILGAELHINENINIDQHSNGTKKTISLRSYLFEINNGSIVTIPSGHVELKKYLGSLDTNGLFRISGGVTVNSGATLVLGENDGIRCELLGTLNVKNGGTLRLSSNFTEIKNGGYTIWTEPTGSKGRIILEVGAKVIVPANFFVKDGVACKNSSLHTVVASDATGNSIAAGTYTYDSDHKVWVNGTRGDVSNADKGVGTPHRIYVNTYGGGSVSSSAESSAPGAKITITATPSTGYVFDGWTTSDVKLDDASKSTTSFIMPDKSVSVRAQFTRTGGGSGSGGSGSGGYGGYTGSSSGGSGGCSVGFGLASLVGAALLIMKKR